jgi:hypothetical protein
MWFGHQREQGTGCSMAEGSRCRCTGRAGHPSVHGPISSAHPPPLLLMCLPCPPGIRVLMVPCATSRCHVAMCAMCLCHRCHHLLLLNTHWHHQLWQLTQPHATSRHHVTMCAMHLCHCCHLCLLLDTHQCHQLWQSTHHCLHPLQWL